MKITRMDIHRLTDLLQREVDEGVISMDFFLKTISAGMIPKQIVDLAGNVHMAIERTADGFFKVTEYATVSSR